MASLDRRSFVQTAAFAAAFGGLHRFVHAGNTPGWPGPGLVSDPKGQFDLPEGFDYTIISRRGEQMTDGFRVPGQHDGMAAFPGSGDEVILMRNHEQVRSPKGWSPYHESAPASRLEGKAWDLGDDPFLGGVTAVVYDTKKRTLVSHRLALAGPAHNCAGGATPWGTWLSCEEWIDVDDTSTQRDHGWVFEVPAHATGECSMPEPLRALGRFRHEAVAVDATSGVLYLTEDEHDGLLYRFVPEVKGDLSAGKLQALAIQKAPRSDLRNWDQDSPGPSPVTGDTLPVEWVDLLDIHAPRGDLRIRGHEIPGAARFARGEGIWAGNGSVYVACTNGGRSRIGQIWRYHPSPFEGTDQEAASPGQLELFVESPDKLTLHYADNLVVAPWGDVFVSEDGEGHDRVIRIDPQGRCTPFLANRLSSSELTGVCFSPDGNTMFVNEQGSGLTLAVHGPFRERFAQA